MDLGGEALEVAAGRGFACARLAKSQAPSSGIHKGFLKRDL